MINAQFCPPLDIPLFRSNDLTLSLSLSLCLRIIANIADQRRGRSLDKRGEPSRGDKPFAAKAEQPDLRRASLTSLLIEGNVAAS